MNVSSYYDYYRYLQNSGLTSSTQGTQKTDLDKTGSQDDGMLMQLLLATAGQTQNAAGSKPQDPLDSLVSSGVITSDQEKSIKEAFEKARLAFQTQAGAANASDAQKNPLDSLISSGLITEDQAKAVKSALDSAKKAGMMQPPPPPPPPPSLQAQTGTDEDTLSGILDDLVVQGTINSDQENTIKSAFEKALEAYQNQLTYYI